MVKMIQKDPESLFYGIKVLYVEDDRFSREKLLRILERRFSTVFVGIDGDEGFNLYQKYKPDIVIADIKIDKMNGLDMIERIRQQNENTQIIVTTAYEDSEYFLQAIENNVNHFILKPIDLEKLLQAIQNSIHHIRLEKELQKQKTLSRLIMDFQDNLIFVTENEQIIDRNRSFSDFTGIEKIPGTTVKSLSKLFVEDSKYFYPESQENWLQLFLGDHDGSAKIRWMGKKGKECIFLMKATAVPGEKKHLFICTDITELEYENKKIEFLSALDQMTKIYNRLKFDEILSSEMKRSERFNRDFSVILFDIDHFRRINDQFGPQYCDEALIMLSTIVQQRIRETDVFARWGGDEFILITPEENEEGAAVLAESIRTLIEGFSFPHIGSLTCSFGVTPFTSGKTKIQILNELDKAINESKRKGSNCVTIYHKKDVRYREEGVSSV